MSVEYGRAGNGGTPEPDYDDWSDSAVSDKVLVTKCGCTMNLTDEKLCAFVGTNPEADFNIYRCYKDSRKLGINKQERMHVWKGKMGPVHIVQ